MSSGRHESVKRHRGRFHNGIGEIVTLIQYITGVKSGAYPAPTYTPNIHRHTLSNESRITGGNIVLQFADLQGYWLKKFEDMLNAILHDSQKNYDFDKVLGSYDKRISAVPISYHGYVCPKCLCIGLAIDEGLAYDVAHGDHLCELEALTNPRVQLEHSKKQEIVNRLFQVEVPQLLFSTTKTLARGRQILLCAVRGSQSQTNVTIDSTGRQWIQQAALYGEKELNLAQLFDFLMQAKCVRGYFRIRTGSFLILITFLLRLDRKMIGRWHEKIPNFVHSK